MGDRLSDHLKEKLNLETQEILNKCLREVEDLLKREEPLLEEFTKQLLEKDELDFDQIEAIFVQLGKQRAIPISS
jgi:ATP-dependent Zn protease